MPSGQLIATAGVTVAIFAIVAAVVYDAGSSNVQAPTSQASIAGGPSAAEAVSAPERSTPAECADIHSRHGFHACVDQKSRLWVSNFLGKPALVDMDGDLEIWYYGSSQISVIDETRGFNVGAKIYFPAEGLGDEVVEVIFVA